MLALWAQRIGSPAIPRRIEPGAFEQDDDCLWRTTKRRARGVISDQPTLLVTMLLSLDRGVGWWRVKPQQVRESWITVEPRQFERAAVIF